MEAKLDGNDVTVLFGGQPVDSMASANLEDTAVLLLGEEVVRAIQYEDGEEFHRVDPETERRMIESAHTKKISKTLWKQYARRGPPPENYHLFGAEPAARLSTALAATFAPPPPKRKRNVWADALAEDDWGTARNKLYGSDWKFMVQHEELTQKRWRESKDPSYIS